MPRHADARARVIARIDARDAPAWTNVESGDERERDSAEIRRVMGADDARGWTRSWTRSRRFGRARAIGWVCALVVCAVALVGVGRGRGCGEGGVGTRARDADADADADAARARAEVVDRGTERVAGVVGAEAKDGGTRARAPTRGFFDEAVRMNRTGEFFDAFFATRLGDAAEFDGVVVSRAALNALAARSNPKLSVYRLSRNGGGGAAWSHVSGPSTFWSTNDFHAYVRTHVNAISEGLPDDFREAYFLINNFDEPQAVGERCGADLARLRELHANVVQGVISPADNVPVWSMSKIRGCHRDILFPFPDYFARLRANIAERTACTTPWTNRASDIAFRGSTTGFGDARTNLRARTLGQLINEPGFNVGFTAAIQGFQQSWAPHLFREKMSGEDFCKYKAIMDIDGNSHSFNRQLLIAEAGAVMVRVNVFTDWFAEGVLGDEFCYVVDPSDVLASSRRARASLSSEPARAEEIARAYSRLAKWAVQDDVAIRYLREAFSRYIAGVRFTE